MRENSSNNQWLRSAEEQPTIVGMGGKHAGDAQNASLRRRGRVRQRHPPRARRSPAWPTRPIRIIIPTAPGGSPDLVARTIGGKLTERLGQPVVVESITQGVGLVANQMVSRATPDGHTLAMLTGGFTTQAAVLKSLPFDPLNAFSFVTTVVVLSDVSAGRAEFADRELQGFGRPRQARTRQGQLRDHRQRQRLSLAREMDREPGRHRTGRHSLPRIGRRPSPT